MSLVETRRVEQLGVEKIRLTKNLESEELEKIRAHLKDLDQ